MYRTLIHILGFEALRQRRCTVHRLLGRATIILAATLVVSNFLAAVARADSAYSATLEASLTVTGFLDAEGNTISKPAGLTVTNIGTFSDDESFIIVEGDATADANAAIDVIAGDPFDLVAGDRFDFNTAVSGTTVYPTGFSYAMAIGGVQILAENNSPDPVTILFDFEYDYTLNTSVDNPELEFAYAAVGYQVYKDSDVFGELEFFLVENNASETDMGSVTLEVTLLAGQSESVSALAIAGGDPVTIPEPTSWMLSVLGAAMLLGRSSACLACARTRN